MRILTGYEVGPGSLRDFNGLRSMANQRANRNINTADVEDHSVTPCRFLPSCLEITSLSRSFSLSTSNVDDDSMPVGAPVSQ